MTSKWQIYDKLNILMASVYGRKCLLTLKQTKVLAIGRSLYFYPRLETPASKWSGSKKSLKAPGSFSLWRSCCRSRHYYSAMTLLQRHWHFPAPGWTKLYSFGQPLRAIPHGANKGLSKYCGIVPCAKNLPRQTRHNQKATITAANLFAVCGASDLWKLVGL